MTTDVLILLSTQQRRGAEIEGLNLGEALRPGLNVSVMALTESATGIRLGVDALGQRSLSVPTLRRLRSAAKRVDVVIAYGARTIPACALALSGQSTPWIARSIGDPAHWIRNEAHRRRTAWFYRQADMAVALWPGAATTLTESFGLAPARVTVIPNARSTEEFRPPTADERAAARAAWGCNGPTLTCLGSLTHEKNVGLAIATARLLPEFQLLVAGDGPERPELETAAQGARVRFLGAVDDVPSLLWAADALLLTSRTEGMPGVAIEAGLAGVPVVTADVGAAATVVRNAVTGYVVGSTDPSDFAAACRVAIGNQDGLGAQARAWCASRFGSDVVTPIWRDVVTALVAGR